MNKVVVTEVNMGIDFHKYLNSIEKLSKDVGILMSFSDRVADVIRGSFSNEKVYSPENIKQICELEKSNNTGIVIRTSMQMPPEKCAAFKLIRNSDGKEFYAECSATSLSCVIAPLIEMFSNSRGDLIQIINKVSSIFENGIKIKAEYNKEYYQLVEVFDNSVVTDKNIREYSIQGHCVYGVSVNLSAARIALPFPSLDSITDCTLKNMRLSQIGMFSTTYCFAKYNEDIEYMYNAIGRFISQYDSLVNRATFGQKCNSLSWGKDYKALKKEIRMKHEITDEIVQKTFTWQMLLYPRLAEDIRNRTDSRIVRERMFKNCIEYRCLFDTICDYFNLPTTLNVEHEDHSSLNSNMRSRDGISYLFERLKSNPSTSIDTIIKEYKKEVTIKAEEGYERYLTISEAMDERRAERRAAFRSFASNYAANKLANRKIEKELESIRKGKKIKK